MIQTCRKERIPMIKFTGNQLKKVEQEDQIYGRYKEFMKHLKERM
jgi:hypothetical protein